MSLTDTVSRAKTEVERKINRNPKLRRLLSIALMTGAVLGAGEIISPTEAHACASFYNPDNSFYNRHVKPIVKNPEILQKEGDKAYAILWFPSSIGINLVQALTYPESIKSAEEYLPEFVPEFIYTDRERIRQKPQKATLYNDLGSALKKLKNMKGYAGEQDVYVLGFEAVRYSETTPWNIVVHPKKEIIASSLHDPNGKPLNLSSKKPTLVQRLPPQNPSRECRTIYQLPRLSRQSRF
ncbi:MAG: hypothetical protein Q8R04_05150 [Nanoarchaeota archaeon]|nr:hypothetical protein [Nanoarchaeota archaeon]